MAIPAINKGLITGGNSDSEKAILSVVEAQVRGILTNENATMYFKTSAVADQIEVLNGVGMAIYRLAERVSWGSTYDPVTGTKKQWRSVKTTTVIIDQKLTIDWAVEDFDMERFLASDPNVRATLLAEWSASMISGYLFVMEAIFLTGIKDYCIAKNQVLPIDLLNLDADKAVEAFYAIGKQNNKLLKKVTMTEVGVNLTDINGTVGLDSYLELTKVFQKLNYGQIAADTITTGKLYKDSAFGMDLVQSFYLEQLFTHGEETGLHLEKTFDLTNIYGAFVHKNAVAMPSSFQTIRQLIDPNTGNLKWIGKALYAVPTAIRGDLMYIIMPKAPTEEEIKAAQAKEWNADSSEQKVNATFKLADFDKFEEQKKKIADLIKVTDTSGENVPVATNDDKPVGGQIANAIIAKNPGATINDFNIADDSVVVTKKPEDGESYVYGEYTAVLTGAGQYEGTLDIKGTFGRLNP